MGFLDGLEPSRYIKIYVRPTRFIVSYKNIYPTNVVNTQPGSRYALMNLLRDFKYKHLTNYEYDRRHNRFIPDRHFALHDERKMRFRFPISMLDTFINFMKQHNYNVVTKGNKLKVARHIDIGFKFTLRENQKPAVEFALEGYKTMRCLELPTGFGKTICAIKVAHTLKCPFMIVVNSLLDQWEARILESTNIKKEQISRIEGIDTIRALQKRLDKDDPPDVLLCTMSTTRYLCLHEGDYKHLPTLQQFINRCGIGLKVVDEAHLNFHASCLIDLSTDIRHNLYLTATFNHDDKSLKRVFNNYYPPSIKLTIQPDRYTQVYAYSYLINVNARRCMSNYGYSQPKYEALLLRQNDAYGFYKTVILPLLDHHYFANERMKGKRALVFCGTINMIDAMVKHTKQTVGDAYRVSRFTKDEPKSVLTENDVIFATMKGCGVGDDIKDLALVINTVSFKGYNMVKQAFGRLREPPPGEERIYVDLRNVRVPSHELHYRSRRNILETIAESYSECNL